MVVGALLELSEFPPRPPSQSEATGPTGQRLESTHLAAGTNVDGKMPDEPFLARDGEPKLRATLGRARLN